MYVYSVALCMGKLFNYLPEGCFSLTFDLNHSISRIIIHFYFWNLWFNFPVCFFSFFFFKNFSDQNNYKNKTYQEITKTYNQRM